MRPITNPSDIYLFANILHNFRHFFVACAISVIGQNKGLVQTGVWVDYDYLFVLNVAGLDSTWACHSQ